MPEVHGLLPLTLYRGWPEDALARHLARKREQAQRCADFFSPAGAVLPARNFANIAEILLAAAPQAEDTHLQCAVRFSMWMYLLDYYVDEVPNNADEIAAIHRSVEEVLDGRGAEPQFLYTSLAEILGEHAQHRHAPETFHYFKRQIRRELAADRSLLAYGGAVRSGTKLPEYEVWAIDAATGVNHVSCSMSLLLALRPQIEFSELRGLDSALRPAANAIRLANDIRTCKKDDAEGLLHSLRFMSIEESHARLHRHLAAMDDAVAEFLRAGFRAQYAQTLARLTRAGVEVYGITDIRYDS